MPASFNGLYGLEPSFRWMPLEGVERVMAEQDVISLSLGLLETTAGSLELAIRWILESKVRERDSRVMDGFTEAKKGTEGIRMERECCVSQ
jgi:Asp-tRNA(Asn)/Glu-tRNA(Gln) amidotransferase A subunit family amidase